MGNLLRSAAIFGFGVVVGSLTIPALSAQFRSAKVTRLITTDLTGFCDGKDVIVELNEVRSGNERQALSPWTFLRLRDRGIPDNYGRRTGSENVSGRRCFTRGAEPGAHVREFSDDEALPHQNIGKGQAGDRPRTVAFAEADRSEALTVEDVHRRCQACGTCSR